MTAPHISRPGPQHWDWRCLTCDRPVMDRQAHPGPLRLFLDWLLRSRDWRWTP